MVVLRQIFVKISCRANGLGGQTILSSIVQQHMQSQFRGHCFPLKHCIHVCISRKTKRKRLLHAYKCGVSIRNGEQSIGDIVLGVPG